MTLQASGTIKLSEIEDEFGGSTPTSLSEYYSAASGVPASGTISLSDFYGTSAVIQPNFSSSSYTVNAQNTWSGGAGVTSTAQITFANTGSITGSAITSGTASSGSYEDDGEVVEADYDIRLTKISGDNLTAGSQGTWLNLGTSRVFNVSITAGSGGGSISGSWTAEIRPAGGGSTIDSSTINLTATIIDSV